MERNDLFFAYSVKGNCNLDRQPRKCGAKASTAGIIEEKVLAIATYCRNGNKDFKVATNGRVSKEILDPALLGEMDKDAALYSDSHRSYTALAKSKDFKHKKFNASKG